MKTTITERANAKINLTLEVLEKRSDGYHNLKSVMQSLQLCDEITLTRTGDGEVIVTSNQNGIPLDKTNTVAAAVGAFAEKTGVTVGGLTIHIEKKIPVAAGLAGGSSDAAAVLRGLNVLCETGLAPWKMAEIGMSVGSDVPYCVYSSCAIVEGKGERVSQLPGMPPCWIVLCKPGFSLSTPEMYRKMDKLELTVRPKTANVLRGLRHQDLDVIAKHMGNVFEEVLTEEQRYVVDGIKKAMLDAGAIGALMSGSGPTTYGIFTELAAAEKSMEPLRQAYREVFLTQPV